MKLAPTNDVIQIDTIPNVGPLYIEGFVVGDRPPLGKCARLQT